MNPISTAANWNTMLFNLDSAEQTENTAEAQVSTGKVATDLEGYGATSQTISAYSASQTRLQGFITANQSVSARLTVQDSAMTEVSGAGTSARSAVASALAAGDATGLMQSLQTDYQQAVDGLNTQTNGVYVFGGGLTSQPPVSITDLTTLGAAASPAAAFQNGPLQTVSKIDSTTSVQTGFLASDVGQPLVGAFQAIAAYNAGPNGPLTGTLNPTQTAFLQSQLSVFDTANTNVTAQQAQNGSVQKEVTDTITNQQNQSDTLTTLIGNDTEVDMATALTQLSQAQTAVQASSQVLAGLKNDSLLNILPVG
jgi:flagellar hook-associated protein 3 FlgL